MSNLILNPNIILIFKQKWIRKENYHIEQIEFLLKSTKYQILFIYFNLFEPPNTLNSLISSLSQTSLSNLSILIPTKSHKYHPLPEKRIHCIITRTNSRPIPNTNPSLYAIFLEPLNTVYASKDRKKKKRKIAISRDYRQRWPHYGQKGRSPEGASEAKGGWHLVVEVALGRGKAERIPARPATCLPTLSAPPRFPVFERSLLLAHAVPCWDVRRPRHRADTHRTTELRASQRSGNVLEVTCPSRYPRRRKRKKGVSYLPPVHEQPHRRVRSSRHRCSPSYGSAGNHRAGIPRVPLNDATRAYLGCRCGFAAPRLGRASTPLERHVSRFLSVGGALERTRTKMDDAPRVSILETWLMDTV